LLLHIVTVLIGKQQNNMSKILKSMHKCKKPTICGLFDEFIINNLLVKHAGNDLGSQATATAGVWATTTQGEEV
jgi:hypothetical protein